MSKQTTASQIRVEFYGMLQDVCGGSEREITVDATPVTVAGVLAALERAVPALGAHLHYTACAVGDRLVERDALLAANDTLVLLPPVSGG